MSKLRKLRRRLIRRIKFLGYGFSPSLLRLPGSKQSLLIGSQYGGWHVLPVLLNQNSTIYSLGLGRDISFDLGMIEQFSLTVHGFDPTPLSADWIRSQSLPSKFHFHEIGVSDEDGEMQLFEPAQDGFVSHTLKAQSDGQATVAVPVRRVLTIMADLNHQHIDLLKMDIEGCEYQVIDDMLESKIIPSQLLVEFHHSVLDMGFEPTRSAFDKLLGHGYQLFHISDNGNEYCFVHDSSLTQLGAEA